MNESLAPAVPSSPSSSAASSSAASPSAASRAVAPIVAPLEVLVDLTTENNLWCDLDMALADGGVFVATFEALPIGSLVDLALHLPDAPEPIAVRGVVRWTRAYQEDDAVSAGVGVQFLDIQGDDEARLTWFAARVREPLFFALDEAA